MDIDEVSLDPYGRMLDVAGKLVAVFGFVLGLAYIAGWVYLKSYYGSFNATWVVEFFDAQAFIQAGLLWVVYCSIISGAVIASFKHSDDIRAFGQGYAVLGGVIVIGLTAVSEMLGRTVDSNSLMQAIGPMMMGAYSSLCIAAAFRAIHEKKSMKFMLVSGAFGFLWMTVATPWMYAYSKTLDAKYVDAAQTVFLNKESGSRGLLLGVASGKVILSECKTHNIYVAEPSDKIIFMSEKKFCE